MAIHSPLLWQNGEQTVTLIDIPRSIAAAQGTSDQPCPDHLLSTAPLEIPYSTNEPKPAKARANLSHNTVAAALHEEYATLLAGAMNEVRSGHSGAWCKPRSFVEDAPGAKKRKLDQSGDVKKPALMLDELSAGFLPHHAARGIAVAYGVDADDGIDTLSADGSILTLSDPSDTSSPQSFRIPPQATFSLSSCTEVRSFHSYVRSQAQELDTPRTFDFILLDPPWPNSSVKRTHKTANSTYNTMPTLWDIQDLLFGMDLDSLMADQSLVGVWITNKPAVRDLVLGEGGLFDSWGVELEEEWMWLKTTLHGEPVTPLDSMWRKPYEVLLLGRRHRDYCGQACERKIDCKVIISVPDLHSRKPCLKELVEPMMPDPARYRALEVFARHLVAGWWSWGDECIKFNLEGYWRKHEPSGPDKARRQAE